MLSPTLSPGATAPSPTPAYWPWVAQPSVTLMLQMAPPPAADWTRLDEWICHAWGINSIDEVECMQSEAREFPVVQMMRRTATINALLLRAMGWPVFERSSIRSVQALPDQPGQYRVQLQVACTHDMPMAWYRKTFQQAHALVVRGLQAATTADAWNADIEQLHEHFVASGKRAIPSGKSTLPLLKAAHSLNLPFIHLGGGLYQVGWGCRSHILDRSSVLADSAIGAKLCHDKATTSALLARAGLPTPRHVAVRTAEQAIAAAQTLGYPVVLKPQDRERGEGVTVNIASAEQLQAAFDNTASISSKWLVEKQVSGTCYRVLVVGDRIAGVIRRNPRSIKGDGEHTIEQLIEQHSATNAAKAKHRQAAPLPTDALALQCLQEAGFTLQSIPAEGVLAPLRPIETGDWGGSPEEVTDILHPDNAALAVRAARALGLQVLGLDLVSLDIAVPWHQNGAQIIECNYAPQVVGFSEKRQAIAQAQWQALQPPPGRIPVHVFVGGDSAWQAALDWQGQQINAGVAACITSELTTHTPEGKLQLNVAGDPLHHRARALLMDRHTEALGLVVQTDECLRQGLPVDTIESLQVLSGPLPGISTRQTQQLIEFLHAYRERGGS